MLEHAGADNVVYLNLGSHELWWAADAIVGTLVDEACKAEIWKLVTRIVSMLPKVAARSFKQSCDDDVRVNTW